MRPAFFKAATCSLVVLKPSTSYTAAFTDGSSVPVSCHCQLTCGAGCQRCPGAGSGDRSSGSGGSGADVQEARSRSGPTAARAVRGAHAVASRAYG
ncbi:hypothetical protein ACFSNO_28750, partial [Streptomyces cirratus]